MPWLIPVVVSLGVVCVLVAAVAAFFVRKGRAAKAEGAVARATATPQSQVVNAGIYGSAASLHLGDNVGVYGSAPQLQHEYDAPPSALSDSRSRVGVYGSPPAVAESETETELHRL
jgi:hypothetical protein